MRIDAFNKVSQLYNANSLKNTTKTKGGSFSDKLEISQLGKDYQVAKQIMSQTPDTRDNLINDIKQRLENGTYQVDDQMIADKLVERYYS